MNIHVKQRYPCTFKEKTQVVNLFISDNPSTGIFDISFF